uniref:Thiamin biosynthesis protein S n=1 Tax=Gayliella sp. TaxID=2575623 RepID=A0A4D6WWK2_9FLOR|nr:Thiamin biosynthesis protein S [Gayliella sp.]
MNSQYLKITINGQPFNCYSSMSIEDILLYLNINLHQVIIEYNRQIINSLDFSNILVEEGDSLEIITIVGGG